MLFYCCASVAQILSRHCTFLCHLVHHRTLSKTLLIMIMVTVIKLCRSYNTEKFSLHQLWHNYGIMLYHTTQTCTHMCTYARMYMHTHRQMHNRQTGRHMHTIHSEVLQEGGNEGHSRGQKRLYGSCKSTNINQKYLVK